MTNPFAAATVPGAVIESETEAPAAAAAKPAPKAKAKAAEAPKNLGFSAGDPFAAPKGIGDGEKIVDFLDKLLLVRPTEFIVQMPTKQGPSDAVRCDLAVLDDEDEPGKIVIGVLLFQTALRREAKAVLDNPDVKYLLGRLEVGKTGSGNTIYTFEEATEEDVAVARQFLAARPSAL